LLQSSASEIQEREIHTIKKIVTFVLVACVGVTALASLPGAAQAASRKFEVKNLSSRPLVLSDVHQERCRENDRRCAKTPMYPMEFEGRPEIGAELAPGGVQDFELKYGYWFFGGQAPYPNYAARLSFSSLVWVTIETNNYNNTSSCEVSPYSDLTCTANGTTIEIRDAK
jgi:hypothetical protein